MDIPTSPETSLIVIRRFSTTKFLHYSTFDICNWRAWASRARFYHWYHPDHRGRDCTTCKHIFYSEPFLIYYQYSKCFEAINFIFNIQFMPLTFTKHVHSWKCIHMFVTSVATHQMNRTYFLNTSIAKVYTKLSRKFVFFNLMFTIAQGKRVPYIWWCHHICHSRPLMCK